MSDLFTSESLIHKGGANRMMLPCVGLARRPGWKYYEMWDPCLKWKCSRRRTSGSPISAMLTHISHAKPSEDAFLPIDSSMTIAFNSPLPLISVTRGELKPAIPSLRRFPIFSALPARSSSTSTCEHLDWRFSELSWFFGSVTRALKGQGLKWV